MVEGKSTQKIKLNILSFHGRAALFNHGFIALTSSSGIPTPRVDWILLILLWESYVYLDICCVSKLIHINELIRYISGKK